MLGVASLEQGRAQQIRTVGCLDENRSRGVRAVREGFHKEVIVHQDGGLQDSEGRVPESLGVPAGSMWL